MIIEFALVVGPPGGSNIWSKYSKLYMFFMYTDRHNQPNDDIDVRLITRSNNGRYTAAFNIIMIEDRLGDVIVSN